jgi:hypothetical protein
MDLLLFIVLFSVAGATFILSYRLERLEAAITGLHTRIDYMETRLTARIKRLEDKVDGIQRRIDQNKYVPKEA